MCHKGKLKGKNPQIHETFQIKIFNDEDHGDKIRMAQLESGRKKFSTTFTRIL